jgi:mannitol/fructose-specific phosphotransferase system IIA component (Ntr-type)
MLLGEMLIPEVIKMNLEAREKYEAIAELTDLLVEAHEIPMALRDHVISVVTQREQSMSTGMEHGIALPHGSSERVQDIVAAMAVCPQGLPFDSLDGEPARLVILLILPKQNFPGHVRTLAGIAHLLNNPALREAIIAAKTPDEVLDLIEAEEDREVFDDFRG